MENNSDILEDKRSDWKENHQKIINAYSQFIDEYGYPPTKTQVSERTDLHLNTIINHTKEMKNQDLSELVGDFKILTKKVITSLYNETEEGDVSAIKLFTEIVHDWGVKQRVEGELGFNKELDIDFDKLEPEEAEKLYALIEKATPEDNEDE